MQLSLGNKGVCDIFLNYDIIRDSWLLETLKQFTYTSVLVLMIDRIDLHFNNQVCDLIFEWEKKHISPKNNCKLFYKVHFVQRRKSSLLAKTFENIPPMMTASSGSYSCITYVQWLRNHYWELLLFMMDWAVYSMEKKAKRLWKFIYFVEVFQRFYQNFGRIGNKFVNNSHIPFKKYSIAICFARYSNVLYEFL